MYATTTTGHRTHVTVSKDQRTLQQMIVGGTVARLIQTITSTTEEWFGLSYADAQSVCIASESSTLNGVTRNYLGGAKVTASSGMVTSWTSTWGCWGTKITSQLQRMGDTNLYHVSRTTEELSVSAVGGTLELL